MIARNLSGALVIQSTVKNTVTETLDALGATSRLWLREKADEELDLRDIDGNFQAITAPTMADLLGKRIQYKFEMDEVDKETGAAKLIWYTGRVVCLVNNGKKVRMV